MWENLTLKEVTELAKDPYPSIRAWKKETGKAIIGSTIADVPEEIIYAFGILPVALIGTNKPLKKAPSLLPDNACSLARSNLELALSYEGDMFDGFVLPQVCDTTQHLSDIWRVNFPGTYVECFLAPRQIDRPSARYWVKKETERLIESLSAKFGKTITDDDLKKSFAVHNENKELLKEIYEIKRQYPASITNKEFFSLVRLSMQIDKSEFNRTIRKVKDSLQKKGGDGFTDVLLVGIACDPPEIFDLFDEIRLNTVGDTFITGSRYLEGTIPDGIPVEALVERHFKRGFYSPIHDNVFREFKELKALYDERKAKAIIYVHIEFCESEEYDMPDLKVMLKKENIPVHTLTTEYQTVSLSHIRTRLQAFFESLKGGAL